MQALLRDLRYTARALARTPLFTLGIVVTPALGSRYAAHADRAVHLLDGRVVDEQVEGGAV